MTRAAVFVGAVVLAGLIWDTEADPVRLAHGLPWIFDFVRRMIPPDPRVLPAALVGAGKTGEIALLGPAVAAAPVLPLFLSYVLYRLEPNIRAATVLGFVGAGGIGFYLQTYLRMIDYPAASTVLLVTVAMVMVVDAISSRLRDRLV